jgi:hypothetical protein
LLGQLNPENKMKIVKDGTKSWKIQDENGDCVETGFATKEEAAVAMVDFEVDEVISAELNIAIDHIQAAFPHIKIKEINHLISEITNRLILASRGVV